MARRLTALVIMKALQIGSTGAAVGSTTSSAADLRIATFATQGSASIAMVFVLPHLDPEQIHHIFQKHWKI
ncbi:MAG: hypothetical protein ABIK28_01120 [Planctomycetota bacterium]